MEKTTPTKTVNKTKNEKKVTDTLVATFDQKEHADELRHLIVNHHRKIQPWVFVMKRINLLPLSEGEEIPEVRQTYIEYEVLVASSWGTKLPQDNVDQINETALNYLNRLTSPT